VEKLLTATLPNGEKLVASKSMFKKGLVQNMSLKIFTFNAKH
jgi:hypothetical protein